MFLGKFKRLSFQFFKSPARLKSSSVVLFGLLLLLVQSVAHAQNNSSDAEAKRAEIEAANRRIAANNEIVTRTFKAGNEAFQAGRYDDAIAQYNEGLAADPEQVALWTNKSLALKMRGVSRFNAATKLTDPAAKKSGREMAVQDLRDSFAAVSKALELLKTQPASEPNKYATISALAEIARILGKIASSSIGEAGFTAIQDYVAIEPDEGKRMKAQLDAAQILFDIGQFDKAAFEFRKLVTANSYDFEATLGLGLSLYGTGDKANMAEAEKNLQRFIEIAPDTHPRKTEVKAVLQALKQQH